MGFISFKWCVEDADRRRALELSREKAKDQMTLERAKQIYISAGGPDDYDDKNWEAIREEMAAVVAAESDEAAGKLIEWWGCWESRGELPEHFARRVRKANVSAKRKRMPKKEAKQDV